MDGRAGGRKRGRSRARDSVTIPIMKIVILDRDGVINEDSPNFIKSVAEWHPVPGSLEGIALLCQAGFRVFIASNQSGIGRGLLDETRLGEIHGRMRRLLEDDGALLGPIYHCPHLPAAECGCRKPRPGLVQQAARELTFDPRACVVIGDKACDVQLGQALGARSILVRTGYGAEQASLCGDQADAVVDDLMASVDIVRRWLAAPAPVGR